MDDELLRRLRDHGRYLEREAERIEVPIVSMRTGPRRSTRLLVAVVVVVAIVGLGLTTAALVNRTTRRSPATGPTPAVTTAPLRTTSTTARPATSSTLVPAPPLAEMPRLPSSAVHVDDLPPALTIGVAAWGNGALWLDASDPTCHTNCAWLYRVDLATGGVVPISAAALNGSPGVIAAGDGAVFALSNKYDGSPYYVTRIDPSTGRVAFSVPVPGTSVEGDPRGRLAFGAGKLWFSEGTLPVVEFAPRTGAVLARIRLPGGSNSGAETTGGIGFAFDSSGAWLVGGNSGTALFHLDAATHRAAIVANFGAGFSQSLSADGPYVWTTHWTRQLDLVRVDAASPTRSLATGLPTALVSAAAGEVWFAGYEPGDKTSDPANHYGIVGRIDPVTAKVIGVTELPLTYLDTPQVFVDSGGAWVLDTTRKTLTRISSRG